MFDAVYQSVPLMTKNHSTFQRILNFFFDPFLLSLSAWVYFFLLLSSSYFFLSVFLSPFHFIFFFSFQFSFVSLSCVFLPLLLTLLSFFFYNSPFCVFHLFFAIIYFIFSVSFPFLSFIYKSTFIALPADVTHALGVLFAPLQDGSRKILHFLSSLLTSLFLFFDLPFFIYFHI